MSETCPTVKVKAQTVQGYKIINESDFREGVHELWKPEVVVTVPVPAAKPWNKKQSSELSK